MFCCFFLQKVDMFNHFYSLFLEFGVIENIKVDDLNYNILLNMIMISVGVSLFGILCLGRFMYLFCNVLNQYPELINKKRSFKLSPYDVRNFEEHKYSLTLSNIMFSGFIISQTIVNLFQVYVLGEL